MKYLFILSLTLTLAVSAAEKPVQPQPKVLPIEEAREKEAALLKDVKVAEGFEAVLFAAPPAVNYPVFVAAAPDGTLYVSSDGNGSLGREPHLGRILRLRDLDGDGRADEVKVFVSDVDSPRGLVWDHDRLYVLHPPHISAYLDQDGDGVAEQEQVLVKNIAFGFKDRPADHTSNGLELGVDGWLYAAIGDFGFVEAEGTDGRRLQLRGGGVVRVRTDGSGLELFSRGTRNILEVAVSPLLDGFARDNTNDGGGWDVRFQHFTGLDEHGYPSLYKNFADEIVPPLADYGGGSGCGAAWIDEPNFPAAWNNAPYTADWGHGVIYKHTVEPKGATFAETKKPTSFIRMTRPTDLDVDARGRVYAASWKGATFNWAGPEAGYIVRVTPKGTAPIAASALDFARASEGDLIKSLGSVSHRRRLAAQRELLRRGIDERRALILRAIASSRPAPATDHDHDHKTGLPLAARVAALFLIKQAGGAQSSVALLNLATDPALAPWALRAMTDREDQLANVLAAPLLAGLRALDARTRREAVFSLARLGDPKHARELSKALADPDPVVVHTAVHALAGLRATAPCLSIVDTAPAAAPERAAALRVLQSMHEAGPVGHLIARLNASTNVARGRGIFTALCRLHFKEGEWTGNSWGTRPDTSGPYYQPAQWDSTPHIAVALKDALAKAESEEARFMIGELGRHKIQSDEILELVVSMAGKDATLVPATAAHLARADRVPSEAIGILASAATADATASPTRAHAIAALIKAGSAEAFEAVLMALPKLKEGNGGGRESQQAREAFLNSSKAGEHAALLAKSAGALNESSVWADAALLKLSERKGVPASARDTARQSLDSGWAEPKRRTQILQAVALAEHKAYKDKVVSAAGDPDPAVAQAARRAASALRIERELKTTTEKPVGKLIESMSPADALASVLATKGDIAAGKTVFNRQGCANCHTVVAGEPLRGPFLGNIATIYKRPDLADAILTPNKSIAQGFAAYRFETKDGEEHEGFVIQEAADKVTMRNIAAQEIHLRTTDIARREKLEKSLMPDGLAANLTMAEFASLLDYLESLAGK